MCNVPVLGIASLVCGCQLCWNVLHEARSTLWNGTTATCVSQSKGKIGLEKLWKFHSRECEVAAKPTFSTLIGSIQSELRNLVGVGAAHGCGSE